ncbi:MAG: hypothetical protein U0326_32925 [Polyangiales bacterium]
MKKASVDEVALHGDASDQPLQVGAAGPRTLDAVLLDLAVERLLARMPRITPLRRLFHPVAASTAAMCCCSTSRSEELRLCRRVGPFGGRVDLGGRVGLVVLVVEVNAELARPSTALGVHRRARERVLELAHVARPGIARDEVERVARDVADAPVLVARDLRAGARRAREVLAAPRSGGRNLDDAEAIEEVLAGLPSRTIWVRSRLVAVMIRAQGAWAWRRPRARRCAQHAPRSLPS